MGMSWNEFHHADICWPVVRRRAGVELIELLELTSLFLTQGGWGVLRRSCYPNDAIYRNAVSRLKKQGLVISREGGDTPQLVLTNASVEMLPDYFFPKKKWDKKWNRIWYLLVYDVPEVDRKYRNVLRQFLKKLHLGCLQQSVWVTPHDIRADFDDLSKGASLSAFAYLFESKTVLGLPNSSVVENAWDFERLFAVQEHYCTVAEQNLERLLSGEFKQAELTSLLRLSIDAYHSAMLMDPLLPKGLYPEQYLGIEVYSLHETLMQNIGRQLERCII